MLQPVASATLYHGLAMCHRKCPAHQGPIAIALLSSYVIAPPLAFITHRWNPSYWPQQVTGIQQHDWCRFWQCPNGGKDCKYRHALPPGYVLKSQMKVLPPAQIVLWISCCPSAARACNARSLSANLPVWLPVCLCTRLLATLLENNMLAKNLKCSPARGGCVVQCFLPTVPLFGHTCSAKAARIWV